MAYLNNIPQSSDQLSLSQSQILGNFQALGAIAGNGIASSDSLNTVPGSGFNWVYLSNQGATPPAGAAFVAGAVGLYAATNGTTALNELYINKTTAGGVTQIPATACSTNGTNFGWTYLPSGLKMVWGTGTITVGGTVNVLYSTATGFPGFGTSYSTPQLTRVKLGGTTAGDFLIVAAVSATGFTATSSAGLNNVQFTWFAIGN